MRPTTSHLPSDRRRFKDSLQKMLADDHQRLERLFQSIVDQASCGDAFELREHWRAFEQAVLSHLDAEETHIFPEFAREKPEAASALLLEHDRIRAQATELGMGLDLHCVRADQVTAFVDALRAHARREEAVLYPWAARQLGDAARRRIRRSFLARKEAAPRNTRDKWEIDPQTSSLEFSLRHIVVHEIRGHFTRWGGAISLDPVDPTRSTVHVWIDLASIDTGEHERDEHLRSSEFFDLKLHPQATFTSSGVTAAPGSPVIVRGRLNLHGKTNDVDLTITDQKRWTEASGTERIAYSVRTRFNRQTFGLHWNQDMDIGGLVVGDQVEVVARVEAVRHKAR